MKNLLHIYDNFIYKKYPEEFLRSYIEKEKPFPSFWFYISCHQDLSEQFIEDFQDQLIWESICKYQNLSIEICRKYLNKINWYNICRYGDISEEFMIEFINHIDICLLKYNNRVNEEVFKRIESLKGVIDQ